jgi:hypothetical protein
VSFFRLSFPHWFWRRVVLRAWFRLDACGGCDRLAEDACSSRVPDLAIAFCWGSVLPTLDSCMFYWIMITFICNTLTSPMDFKKERPLIFFFLNYYYYYLIKEEIMDAACNFFALCYTFPVFLCIFYKYLLLMVTPLDSFEQLQN